MRTVLRAATKQYERVAVVCGAWHVPALTAPLPTASADAACPQGTAEGEGRVHLGAVDVRAAGLLAGVRRRRHARPAGTTTCSPPPTGRCPGGWSRSPACCATRACRVSSAHVIEAVRLAEALATLRGRPLAGLAEVTEATRAVLCDGDELRLELIDRRLVVGERLGAVPDDTPAVPLAARPGRRRSGGCG